MSGLISHLQSTHQYMVEVEKLHFQDLTSFFSWKSNEEKKTHSTYVQQCAPRTFTASRHFYYYCNRSGVHRNRSLGVRQTKSQGSSKTGERCTAHMKVMEDLASGEVSIQYCKTHHSHEKNINHL